MEAASLQVKKGVKRLKMVGVHENGWQEDARRVRAVREAIGPDIELMIDANYKFLQSMPNSSAVPLRIVI